MTNRGYTRYKILTSDQEILYTIFIFFSNKYMFYKNTFYIVCAVFPVCYNTNICSVYPRFVK